MLSFPAGCTTGLASYSFSFIQFSMIIKDYFGPTVQTLALVRRRTDLKVLLLVFKAQRGSGPEYTNDQLVDYEA